jgi:transposase-like protein
VRNLGINVHVLEWWRLAIDTTLIKDFPDSVGPRRGENSTQARTCSRESGNKILGKAAAFFAKETK